MRDAKTWRGDDGDLDQLGPHLLLLGLVVELEPAVELLDDLVAAAAGRADDEGAAEALLVHRASLGQGLDELRVVGRVGGTLLATPVLVGARVARGGLGDEVVVLERLVDLGGRERPGAACDGDQGVDVVEGRLTGLSSTQRGTDRAVASRSRSSPSGKSIMP